MHNVFKKQFGVLLRVGSLGRFMTLDLLDRITNIGNAMTSNIDKMTDCQDMTDVYVNYMSNLDK